MEDGLFQIVLEQCLDGKVFDELLPEPGCVEKEDVPQCDIDECGEGHKCDEIGGVCTNTIGLYLCGCDGNFFEYPAPAYNTTDEFHTCEGIDECADPATLYLFM